MMPRIQVVRIGAKLGVGNLRSFVIPVTAAFEQAWSVGQALFADDARRVEQTAGWPARVIAMTRGEWTDPEVGDWKGGRDMRRSGPVDRTGPESSRGRLEPAAVRPSNRRSAGGALATLTRDLGESAIPGPRSGLSQLAGRVRYRLSDIEAYEQAGLVTREPAGTASLGDPSDAGDRSAPHPISRFLNRGFSWAPDSQDPRQVALPPLRSRPRYAGGHTHIGVPELVGDPRNGKVRLIKKCRDCAAKCMRNRPGQAARIQAARIAPRCCFGPIHARGHARPAQRKHSPLCRSQRRVPPTDPRASREGSATGRTFRSSYRAGRRVRAQG